jgi:hypothetical protein
MTESPPQIGQRGWRAWISLFSLPLVALGLACENGAAPKNGPANNDATMPSGGPITSWVNKKSGPPPEVTASISNARTSWKDGQQVFTLTLTNNGTKAETVHAIVYGTNEEIHPPRRAISPPTGYGWFSLVGSKDGKLTGKALESNWKNNPFVTARGGKMPASWVVTIEPTQSKDIEASHTLDDTSPHPAAKGKRLAKEGFTEYTIWLFTTDGQLFEDKTVPAKPPAKVERPTTAKKTPPDTKPEDPEDLAAKQFKLALADLEAMKKDKAREKLQLIIDQYPKTNTAKAAKKLLKELQTG